MSRFLAACLNPTFQRTVSLKNLNKGEVNRAEQARVDAAGKGIHVARVLAQLGGEAVQLTHLGPGKNDFLKLAENDDYTIRWQESNAAIRTCITLLDGNEKSTTEIVEPSEEVDAVTVKSIQAAFEKELAQTDMLILSGSKAPGYPLHLFADWCRLASESGVPVVVDYRGEELAASLPYGPKVVKINLVEFCATFLPDEPVSEADDSLALPAVENKLIELSMDGVDWVISRGAREILCCSGGKLNTFSPKKIVPVNTIGSGDAFTAGLAFSLAAGGDLIEAAKEGARCGSLNAQILRPGTIL